MPWTLENGGPDIHPTKNSVRSVLVFLSSVLVHTLVSLQTLDPYGHLVLQVPGNVSPTLGEGLISLSKFEPPPYRYLYVTHAARALQSHDLSGEGIKLWITDILF